MSAYSVVVVARDHGQELLATLLALRKHATPSEVLLVDNASSGSLSGVARLSQLPVQIVRLSDHGSLGAAYNAGLDAAGCEYALLLHGDVLLESDPAEAVARLSRRPRVGVIGGKLWQAGAAPRRLLHAGYAVGRGRVRPAVIGYREWDGYTEAREVAAVSGACMLLRRGELRFDERFWFCLEDVDICHQYGQRGLATEFLPSLQAVHLKSGGTRERKASLEWALRRLASRWLYHERWCSDAPLAEHPRQWGLRGAATAEHWREVAARAQALGVDRAGEGLRL